MRAVIFYLFLRPLIIANYWLRGHGRRRMKLGELELWVQGYLPDRWFWADRIASGWGYFVGLK